MLCPSVGPSLCWSVGLSVTLFFGGQRLDCEQRMSCRSRRTRSRRTCSTGKPCTLLSSSPITIRFSHSQKHITNNYFLISFLLSPTQDLELGTRYAVRLQAMTVNGTGPASEWKEAETYMNDLDGKNRGLTFDRLLISSSLEHILKIW